MGLELEVRVRGRGLELGLGGRVRVSGVIRPATIRSPHDTIRIAIQRSRYDTYRDTS